eukprot:2565709-Heterocapsa_arctica.AAC.1
MVFSCKSVRYLRHLRSLRASLCNIYIIGTSSCQPVNGCHEAPLNVVVDVVDDVPARGWLELAKSPSGPDCSASRAHRSCQLRVTRAVVPAAMLAASGSRRAV